MKDPRYKKSTLAIAAILLLLGTGNLLFGLHKYHYYTQVLSVAQTELTSPSETQILPSPFVPISVRLDKQIQHIERLKVRIDFYSFVMWGGVCFLGASFFLILLSVAPNQKLG